MIIYKATFPNKKSYIGQTTLLLCQRKSAHKQSSKELFRISAFYGAIRKYGFNSIKWEVLKTCNSYKEMQKQEKFMIKKLKTISPNGYNIKEGGNQAKMSEETKIKLSKKAIGRKLGKMSEEQKQKISRANKIFYSNPRNKVKISNWRKNRKLTDSQKKKWLEIITKSKLKPILCISKNGEITEFNSITEACKKINIKNSSVSAVLSGRQKTAGSYYWKLKNKNEIL